MNIRLTLDFQKTHQRYLPNVTYMWREFTSMLEFTNLNENNLK